MSVLDLKWKNVAEAAQWLAEGKEVEWRYRGAVNATWQPGAAGAQVLGTRCEYRLKPVPVVPRRWVMHQEGGKMYIHGPDLPLLPTTVEEVFYKDGVNIFDYLGGEQK